METLIVKIINFGGPLSAEEVLFFDLHIADITINNK